MSSWLPHLRNLSAGVFIGVFIGMAYFMIIESDLSDEYTKYWIYGVSALVTLFASGVALAGVLANLETTENHRRDERERKLKASKAMLPAVLSELSSRCERNALIVLAIAGNVSNANDSLSEYSSSDIEPFVEGQMFDVFRDCIEQADEQSALFLTLIAQRYQVAFARCEGKDFPRISATESDLSSLSSFRYAFDWVMLRNYISHCFEFARDEYSSVPDEIDRMTLNSPLRIPLQSRVIRQHSLIQLYESYHAGEVMRLLRSSGERDADESISVTELRRRCWL